MDPRRLRHVFKSSVSQIAQQMTLSVRRAAHQKKIRFPISIKIKKARACACSKRKRAPTLALRNKRIRLHCKMRGNRRRHIRHGAQWEFRRGKFSLIPIARSKRRPQMF